MTEVAVVILNWNGKEDTLKCIDSIKKQTVGAKIVVVDNGSTDGLCEKLRPEDSIKVIRNEHNLGFAGGVNCGIRYAINQGYKYVALINNDAIPEKNWVKELYADFDKNVGISTGVLIQPDGALDSAGDQYSIWGLPWPRGRGSKDLDSYRKSEDVFAASGGGSMYRVEMLKDVGLFDEDFFAYYEDVDLSFRAQLAGWRVLYNPRAKAIHKLSASSKKVPNLTAYMMLKNMVWLFWKNVPTSLMPKMLPRFIITYTFTFWSYVFKGKALVAIKAFLVSSVLLPKKIIQRYNIQKSAQVNKEYIDSLLLQDLPPNAHMLRKFRIAARIKT